MKAIVFEEHGDVGKLQYKDVPEPKIGPNEALIKIKAAGCNYNDIWARKGLPGMEIIMPHVSGSDAAGEVVEVGSEVKSVKVGDEVMVHPGISCRTCEACTSGQEFFCRQYRIWGFQTGPLDGADAEYGRLPEVNLIPKPSQISFEEAATLPLTLMTVWRMLVSRARIQAGDYVLIWGGAGGLGSMAIQVCNLFGARGIAVVGSDKKAKYAKDLGAFETINRNSQSVRDEVKRITNRAGVDIVFEHTGEATWKDSIAALKRGGTLVTCGATSGFIGQTDIRFLWNKQMNFYGSHMGSKGELLQAMKFVHSGQIKPLMSEAFALKDASKAQKLMEDGEVMGKLALVPDHA
ncbi:MAG: zinc-binding dehydrogenase [Chloroflexi bacterium]|nr:zinc-binding dehydrogenase [Chloroflexota bacterium]